ncbi:MAG: LrgB family protein [Pseudomonadota bacterium]
MTEVLDILRGQALLAIGATLAAYAVSDVVWRYAGQPALLNPVLVASALLGAVMFLIGIPYAEYAVGAAPITETLPVLAVLLAVPLCRQFHLIRSAQTAVIPTVVFGCLIALITALTLPLMTGASETVLASLAVKSSTTSVAVEVADQMGGHASITAVVVICTGVFGAACGPGLLKATGVADHRAIGLALGVAAHAIGTARAFQISETAGAFASVGMILNALLTIALAPWIASVIAH